MVKKRETAKAATSTTRKREKTTLRTTQPPRLILHDEELYERVARKAYELYQQRGEDHGHDFEDWLTAERLVQEELLHGPLPEAPLMEEV
jgi:hypothetical protein